jgi:putative membrane protein
MGIRFLVAFSLLTPTIAAAQTAAQHTALATDSNFIGAAMSVGLLQAQLGDMAREQGTSDVVRDYARRIVADYAKVNQQLATGAREAAYPHPVLLRPHQKIVDRFNYMSTSHFDKEYMAETVRQHDAAVRLFEAEAKDGKVASLKQLAVSLLPDLQQDQALAQKAAGAVGAAEITTSAAR